MKNFIASIVVAALAWSGPALAGNKNKTPEQRFKKMDRNGDGKIEKSEFQGRRGGQNSKKDKAFSRADANGDGSITPEEFSKAANQRGKRNRQ